MNSPKNPSGPLFERATVLRNQFEGRLHEYVTETTYSIAGDIVADCVQKTGSTRSKVNVWLDYVLTSRLTGFPIMLGLLGLVFWFTISGANIPSAFLAGVLIEAGGLSDWLAKYLGIHAAPALLSVSLYEILSAVFFWANAPAWLTGFLVDGVYLSLAWVVAVMLPPMAIFFPIFTILEDFGYLPRVAFNLDRFLRAAGAHGKQALTMAMGFGCNAAGVIACRIIESPRERLIAILTNNFVPCNGRWPMLIMVASLFVAASIPPGWAAIVMALTLLAVTVLGVMATLVVSFFLSRTLLKGVASSFTLEMPPFRPPQVGRVLYTSFIDRTLFVLWRAIICAAPAGGLIWLLGAISVGDTSAFAWLRHLLDPIGHTIGLDGVILIAFIFAIPANEIVIPTIIMGYMQETRMIELDDPSMLFVENGWTMVTAVCLMLFALLHYPCTTTTLTIWKETRSIKWTVASNIIPLTVAVAVCATVAQTARVLGF